MNKDGTKPQERSQHHYEQNNSLPIEVEVTMGVFNRNIHHTTNQNSSYQGKKAKSNLQQPMQKSYDRHSLDLMQYTIHFLQH